MIKKLWLTPKEFAELGHLPEGCLGIRKTFDTTLQIKAEDDDKPVHFIISTSSFDRDNDTIKSKGFTLKNFRKNPVVLFAHDARSLPIGKSTKIFATDNTLEAFTAFTPEELNPLGDTVRRMIKAGFLNATSVGFKPDKFERRGFEDENGFGTDFIKQDLLEFSVVPVPANPEALVQARSLGIDMGPVKQWAEEVLEGEMGPGLWVPRAQVEAVHKILSDKKLFDFGQGNLFEGATTQSPEYLAFFGKGEDDDTEPGVETPPEIETPAAPPATEMDATAPEPEGDPPADSIPSAAPVEPRDRAAYVQSKDGEVTATVELSAGEKIALGPVQFTAPTSGVYMLVYSAEDKGTISFNSAHPGGTPKASEDAAWNGSREIAGAEVSDLKIMSAWVDSENRDKKSAFKLPHHKSAGSHSVVLRGVNAAMAALLGARGGVRIPDSDRRGVFNHLAKHLKEFDRDAPEFRDYTEEQFAKYVEAEDAKGVVLHLDDEEVDLGDLTAEDVAAAVREAVREEGKEYRANVLGIVD